MKAEMLNIKRILIIRTDRIGDVVLSTPVITATRAAFPDAYIAMVVSPETKDIVAQNPYLNEVIIYDKIEKHRGFLKTLQFASWLKEKKFDLALILHSTKRINLISFLAGIPERAGYARGKMDFLLTHKLEYKKRLGEKHESEYSLDILRAIGIDVKPVPLFVPVREEDERRIGGLLGECGLKQNEKFIVIHPGASSLSKMWPVENFARLADRLIERFGVRVVLISSPEQVNIGEGVKALMKNEPLFLCGKTSIGELAPLFKKSIGFISNDSGPVHIASAVDAPVISIFSRNEKGLSPQRWKPLGEKGVSIHKDIGCRPCLAHNCEKDFLCIKSVSVEEVLDAAKKFIRDSDLFSN